MLPNSTHRLLRLPAEILLEILRNLDYQTLLQCCLVCRALKNFIGSYSELQYVVELGADGMVDGSSRSLSYAERLKMLLDRRKAWLTLTWKRHSIVPMPGACQAYELVGGVFAKTTGGRHFIASWLPSATEDGHQLPRDDLGLSTRDFAIDPTQDLVAFVEDDNLPDTYISQRTVRIHIRTITTNQPHPNARSPVIQFQIPASAAGNSIRTAFIQIANDVIGMFISIGPGISRILVWTWMDGSLLIDHHNDDLPLDTWDFSFLSPRAYILTSSADQGSIHIFTFESPAPSSSTHIVTLLLPELEDHVIIQYLTTHTGPFHARCPPNKPFTTSPKSRIHVMSIQYDSMDHHAHPSYCFFIHNHALLEYISTYSFRNECDMFTIPWENWGPRNTRFLARQVPFHWLRYVQGQRVVCPPAGDNKRRFLQVLDFNVHLPRTRARDADMGKLFAMPTRIRPNNIFKREVITTLPYYTATRLILEHYAAFMVDEERILGLKSEGIADEDINDIHVFMF